MTSAAEHGYVPLNEHAHSGHAKLLALVGSGKRVLDVGCSSGYLARPLVARGCTVIGLERDPDAAADARAVCDDVLVGDVETMELPFEPGSFDVVLCGDLIEHLRDPERVPRTHAPAAPGRREARAHDAERRELGDAAGASGRPLEVHGERHPRPHAHAPLHARDARRDARARGLPHRGLSTSPFRSPSPGRRRPSASHMPSAPSPSALRVPVRRRGDACVISVVIPVKDGGADLVRCLDAIGRQVVDGEGRDRRRRLRLARRQRRCGARSRRTCARDPPAEFGHGRTRNLGASSLRARSSSSRARTRSRPTRRWLAALAAAARATERRRRGVRAPAPT